MHELHTTDFDTWLKMQELHTTDFDTWLKDNSDKLFRFWVYRHPNTESQEGYFDDQTIYEESECSFGYIREAIKLPDNDILLGFGMWDMGDYIEYYKLSEIRFGYMPHDIDDRLEEQMLYDLES